MLPNLKRLRQEYGISQQPLADALQISQPSINKYENHKIEPEIEILKRMASYFNTSIDYIVGYTDVRRKIEAAEPYALNAQEAELVTCFRALKPEEQECVRTVVKTLLKK